MYRLNERALNEYVDGLLHASTYFCMYCLYLYSGTSLIWTPLGQTGVSLIERCP